MCPRFKINIWIACSVLQVFSWQSRTLCTPTHPRQLLSCLHIHTHPAQNPMLITSPIQTPTKQVECFPPCTYLDLASLLTVYISAWSLELGASTMLYRFSLNTSTPSQWKLCRPEHQEVSSFLVRGQRIGCNVTYPDHPVYYWCCLKQILLCLNRLIISPAAFTPSEWRVCVCNAYHPYPSWMITSAVCDPHHGWMPEFSFYAASPLQQHSRWKHKMKKIRGLSWTLAAF